MKTIVKFHIAKCPICGREYKFAGIYKLPACDNDECLKKFFHPELKLKGKRIV